MNNQQMSQETASEFWQKAIELRRKDKPGDVKKAIQLVTRILEERDNLPPISTKLKTFIGDCYHLNLGQHDKAVDYYQSAIVDDRNEPWASIMLGDIYLNNKKDYKSAVDILERVLALDTLSSMDRDIAKDNLLEAKQKLGK